MKLIVGLGNPGKEYAHHRHNVGFMFVDYMSENAQSKHIFLKPQTFMNKSGGAVQKVMQFYKIPLENLYVVHDDLDIPLGKFKIQKGTGPKLHNGLTSIEEKLGTKNFWRIRIGVENRPTENRPSGEVYVLNNFTPEEHHRITQIFPKMVKQLL